MIYLGSDHRGYEMKEKIKAWFREQGRAFEDMGPDHFDKDDDYPDFISKVGKMVSRHPNDDIGIILGATGQGEAMVANKYPGVRAIVYYGGPDNIVELGRVHNNANVLSIGFAPGNTMSERKEMSPQEVIEHIKKFLDTKFLHEERHVRRVKKIYKLEIKQSVSWLLIGILGGIFLTGWGYETWQDWKQGEQISLMFGIVWIVYVPSMLWIIFSRNKPR